jgi:hypothetical protein
LGAGKSVRFVQPEWTLRTFDNYLFDAVNVQPSGGPVTDPCMRIPASGEPKTVPVPVVNQKAVPVPLVVCVNVIHHPFIAIRLGGRVFHKWRRERVSATRERKVQMKLGPRSAGRSWTPEEDSGLEKLWALGLERELIARKLKRTIQAMQKRLGILRAKGKATLVG